MSKQVVQYEDVAGLPSRVCWGAVFAGAAVSIATYLVLALFLACIGLSLTEAGVRGGAVSIGATIAAVAGMILSLYVGGCVTSHLMAGETQREAVIHGVLTWAVVSGLSLALVGTGVRAGYYALVGSALVSQATNAEATNWEETARRAGVSQTQINQLKENTTPERLRAEAENPENQRKAQEGALVASWATLIATLLSMGAAVGGAVAGSGPTFHLIPNFLHTRRQVTVSH